MKCILCKKESDTNLCEECYNKRVLWCMICGIEIDYPTYVYNKGFYCNTCSEILNKVYQLNWLKHTTYNRESPCSSQGQTIQFWKCSLMVRHKIANLAGVKAFVGSSPTTSAKTLYGEFDSGEQSISLENCIGVTPLRVRISHSPPITRQVNSRELRSSLPSYT